MIKIEQEKCNACGLCVRICHEYCMKLDNGILTIDYKYCSTCTQCIAICPEQALTWDGVKPDFFDRSLYPDPSQFGELLKERRTIRDFTNRKIDRSLLEEIAGYAVYAPTHNFNLRIIIIDDDNIIKLVDSLVLKFSVKLYKWLYKSKIISSLMKFVTPYFESEFLKAKTKLESAKKRNSGFKSTPAAIVLIIGDKRIPLSLESAQYALYNIDLYAQTKGIGCRNLVGNQMILNRSRNFRKLIGLNKNDMIFGTILLGYPAVKFKNKVYGKKLSIQWNTLKN
jgi:NAD-dependent dihydropyrimidine dehydrogenase PreA subunit/nitroreductase